MAKRTTRWWRGSGALAACLILVAGCAAPPRPVEFVGRGGEPDTADGLYRVRSTRIAAAFLKPGADFGAYSSLLIDPVTVSYMSADRAAAKRSRHGSRDLSPEARQRFQRIFQEALEKELARSRYSIVSAPGPGVLRVSGHIVDLFVDVPPFRGGEVDFVLEAGEMTLILNVNDSESGAPLARVAERRGIAPAGRGVTGGFRSSPVSNWAAVRDIFEQWARILREGLDELHALEPVPLPGPPEASS